MRLLLIAALALGFHPAYAITGNEALQQAKTRAGELAVWAYMKGTIESERFLVANARQMTAVGQKPEYPPYCAPESASSEQSWLIVSKFLAEHPEVTHYELGALARAALVNAWPCR